MRTLEMKFAVAVTVFVLVAVQLGYSLKCYECNSDKGWDYCNKTAKTCESEKTRCVVAHLVHGDTKTYHRSCTSKKDCDDVESGKNEHVEKCKKEKGVCKASCCSSDLCNSGNGADSASVVSGFLIMSCASLIFVFQ